MKKAWEWDYELFCSAVPVKNRTDLIEWDGLLEGKFLEEARQMLENGKGAWSKPLPESKAPYSKMLGAISSMANMGYDVSKAEALIPGVRRDSGGAADRFANHQRARVQISGGCAEDPGPSILVPYNL